MKQIIFTQEEYDNQVKEYDELVTQRTEAVKESKEKLSYLSPLGKGLFGKRKQETQSPSTLLQA